MASQAAQAAPAAATTACLAHPANYAKAGIEYAPGCTGHDEPELDPVSSLPGSARNLTFRHHAEMRRAVRA